MSSSILLVEDSQLVSKVMADYLTLAGYTVHCTDNAEDALDYVEHMPVDLGIFDVRLPGMDGFALCDAVYQRHALPVIMMSGLLSSENEEGHAPRAGARALLEKPFDLDALEHEICRILQGR